MGPGACRVLLRGTGAFLPNDPIPNDRIDEVLGPLEDAPPKVRRFMQTAARRMLERALAHGGVHDAAIRNDLAQLANILE